MSKPRPQPPGEGLPLSSVPFVATELEQQRFAAKIVGRRYWRPELPSGSSLLHFSAGALAAAFALATRGPMASSVAAAVAAALHLLLWARALHTERARKTSGSDADFDGADTAKGARPLASLDPGEVVWGIFDAQGDPAPRVRVAAGLAFAGWGILLAGLPFALLPHPGWIGSAVVAVGCFFGSAIFGRGIRNLFRMVPVRQFALTNQRVVAMAGPGIAQSILYRSLRHRPVVVSRTGGRATLAIELRPLASVSPLRFMGLIGLDDVDEPTAIDLARQVVDARQKILHLDDRGRSG